MKQIIDELTAAVKKGWQAETLAESVLPKIKGLPDTMPDTKSQVVLRMAIEKLEAAMPSKARLQTPQITGGDRFKRAALNEIKKLPFDVQQFIGARCVIFELNPKRFKGICSPAGKILVGIAGDLEPGYDFRSTLYHELAHAVQRHKGGNADELAAVRQTNEWIQN